MRAEPAQHPAAVHIFQEQGGGILCSKPWPCCNEISRGFFSQKSELFPGGGPRPDPQTSSGTEAAAPSPEAERAGDSLRPLWQKQSIEEPLRRVGREWASQASCRPCSSSGTRMTRSQKQCKTILEACGTLDLPSQHRHSDTLHAGVLPFRGGEDAAARLQSHHSQKKSLPVSKHVDRIKFRLPGFGKTSEVDV